MDGGINLFAYVRNNPLIRFDIFGLREPFLGTELDPGYLPSYEESGLEAIAEGTRYGWESGYYKCFAKCMLWEGGALAPVVSKLIEEMLTYWIEHGGGGWLGRKYYTIKFPRWFKAGGRYSKVLVPQLAKTLAFGAKVVSVVGWGVFDYDIYYCAKKCSECL